MTMRIYQDIDLSVGQTLLLDQQASAHVAHVMRRTVGDAVTVFNGNGYDVHACIVMIKKNKVTLELEKRRPVSPPSPLETHLAQVISRGERMDYAIQKAVELGVNAITPIFSERCGVKLTGERLLKRQGHWQKVAISALEQSGRADFVRILPAVALTDWARSVPATLKLVCAPQSVKACPWPESIKDAALAVGPEGGFSDDELACFEQHGFLRWQIGPRVLRTETAPVAALALLQLRYGDF
jgi:16S rRNA (uracil1498-N3)-methyltransferase